MAKQTNKNFEVIIVDDGSADDSVAVAEKAMLDFSLTGQVIKRPVEEVKGVASCRNIGIKTASNDWIAFLDSDDLFAPEALQRTMDNILSYGQQCGAFFHAVREFDDETGDTIVLRIQDLEQKPTDIFEQLVHKNFITTSSVTLRKSLIAEVGFFDTSLHGVEDYMMWLRISKRTSWVYCKEVLTEYRVRKASLMGGRRFKYYLEQNVNLLSSIRSSGEFLKTDIESIQKYLDDSTGYYAIISINRWGWMDFLSGIGMLYKTGKSKLATKLLKRHLRNNILRSANKIVRK